MNPKSDSTAGAYAPAGRVVISGAASGIGRATVIQILNQGGMVCGMDNSEFDEELIQHPRFFSHVGDVTQSDDWETLFNLARKSMGGIDALVNVAGIGFTKSLPETTDDDWSRVIGINLLGATLGVRFAFADLIASRGNIVNVSSVLGVAGRPDRTAYAASKGGLISFTKALAAEMGPSGVRVNCVLPGPILTPMLLRGVEALQSDGSINLETFEARTVLQRVGHPDEVASAIVFLISEAASYITGVALPVDGGRLAI